MVMTTGTPAGKDRGAAVLAESARAVKAVVDLPIQVQCEPPEDDIWHERMKNAGADALGMHLEAVTPEVRDRIMLARQAFRLKNTFPASRPQSKCLGGAVSTTSGGSWRYARSHPRYVYPTGCNGRLSICRPVRAYLRHTARKSPRTEIRFHGLHHGSPVADHRRRRT